MIGEKQYFKGTGGFATTKGKRVFVSEPLATHIGWPWSKTEAVLDLTPEPVVEVFDYNGRPLNGLSHFSTEFGLIFADTVEAPPQIPQAPTPEVATLFAGPFPASFEFTTVEDLRRIWRHGLRRPDGPFRLTLHGTIKAGKWKPNGRAKAWFLEPIEIDGLTIQSVKSAWIFLEGDFFVQELQPGATIVLQRFSPSQSVI